MFQNTTNLVGYIALLMTLSAGIVGGFGNDAALASNAFSSRSNLGQEDFMSSDQFTNSASLKESEYVHIYINGVAYEGTLHLVRQ